MTTRIWEREPGEGDATWALRVGRALELIDIAGRGVPDRLIITEVEGARGGYSLTITAVCNDGVDTSSEAS